MRVLPASVRGRVGTVLVAAMIGAIVPSLFLIRGVAEELDDEIADSRLQIAQLMAAQGDRLLTEAFFEIDLMATEFPRRPDGEFLAPDQADARTHFGRSALFSAGIVLLDGVGDVLFAEPNHSFKETTDDGAELALAAAAEAVDRIVSPPYLESATGDVVAALSRPVFGSNGARTGTVVGIVDLSDPFITDLIRPAQRLGDTGHADLVDERGLVLASTNPSHVLTAGDHPEFYVEMSEVGIARITKVGHIADPDEVDQSAIHVMAYAPLREARWGVAMGASKADTYVRTNRVRRSMVVFGTASALTILLGVGLVLRLIPSAAEPHE